jgi:hypothetical protein
MNTVHYTPLTGEETAAVYEAFYSIAGSKLGPLLIDTNVVLTMAGARGSTNLYTPYSDPEIWHQAILLDQKLRPHGIAITPGRIPPNAPAQQQIIVLLIENLRGYAYVSERTRIPGASPFTTGAITAWVLQVAQDLVLAHQYGQFSFPESYLDQLLDGLLEGYPDQAIVDMIDWRIKGKQAALIHAEIPYQQYSGCRHTFTFYPEHALDPSITQVITLWTAILTQFYTSPWFQALKNTVDFQRVRENYRRADQETREMHMREPPVSTTA